MRFRATHYIEVAMWLAMLWVVVSSITQPVLGHLPVEVFYMDVVGEMVAMFWEQVERCCISRILA
jgi:hypothetical protein